MHYSHVQITNIFPQIPFFINNKKYPIIRKDVSRFTGELRYVIQDEDGDTHFIIDKVTSNYKLIKLTNIEEEHEL